MDQAISNGPASPAATQASGPIFKPPSDVVEKGDTVIMLLDLPGADPASLDVTLDKRVLTISTSGTRLDNKHRRPRQGARRQEQASPVAAVMLTSRNDAMS